MRFYLVDCSKSWVHSTEMLVFQAVRTQQKIRSSSVVNIYIYQMYIELCRRLWTTWTSQSFSHIKTLWEDVILHNDMTHTENHKTLITLTQCFLWLTATKSSDSTERNPGDFCHTETLLLLSENTTRSQRAVRRGRCAHLAGDGWASSPPMEEEKEEMCIQATCLFRRMWWGLQTMCASAFMSAV